MTTTDLIVTMITLVSLGVLVTALAIQNAQLKREIEALDASRKMWRKAANQLHDISDWSR